MNKVLAGYQEVEGFVCPAEFWPALGYTGDARFVAIWWEPCGDEASWTDGRLSEIGCEHLFTHGLLTFVTTVRYTETD